MRAHSISTYIALRQRMPLKRRAALASSENLKKSGGETFKKRLKLDPSIRKLGKENRDEKVCFSSQYLFFQSSKNIFFYKEHPRKITIDGKTCFGRLTIKISRACSESMCQCLQPLCTGNWIHGTSIH